MKVRLDLSGLVQDLSRWEVKVLSPDTAQSQFAALSLHGSVSEFTLGRIEHYTVVTLSARPEPEVLSNSLGFLSDCLRHNQLTSFFDHYLSVVGLYEDLVVP